MCDGYRDKYDPHTEITEAIFDQANKYGPNPGPGLKLLDFEEDCCGIYRWDH
jgi:hypothetical protein